jgi:hypothetical protein
VPNPTDPDVVLKRDLAKHLKRHDLGKVIRLAREIDARIKEAG